METRDLVTVDVHGYLRSLYRRRWLAGTAFSIVFAIALLHAFTATPVYRATARLLVEPEDPNIVTFQDVIVERAPFVNNTIQTTQRGMLRSRSLARATIERLELWEHPGFGGRGDRERRFSLLRTLNPWRVVNRALSSVRGAIFSSSDRDDDLAESRLESMAISQLLAGLEVAAVRNSRILTLSYSSVDPRLAADVVNTLARLHIERDMEFRYTSSRDASQWLQQRIAEQRHDLEASERALQRYREEHGAAAIEDRQDIIVRELENLHSAVTSATLVRIESEARYRELQAAQDDPEAVGRSPEILRNEFIQEERLSLAALRRERARLAEELGPRHPDMISIESSIRDTEARLQNEIVAVVDSLRIEYQQASAQERSLQAELETQTQEALALDRTGIEYGVMEREAESNRRLYESLLQRAAETGVTGELETTNIRLLDEAETPIRPVRPRRQLVLLIGLMGGLVLAVGLTFVLEYADDTVRTPEDVKEHFDLAQLGMVPYEEPRAGGSDEPDVSTPPPLVGAPETSARFTESIRSMRTNLLFSSADEGVRKVLVTSTAPGEGKSCLSANLAVVLAGMGLRTLLVDTDLRRPQLHKYFGVDAEPGLSNLLIKDVAENAVIQKTSIDNLQFIAAGRVPPNPADLLGSERFARFVEACGEGFDWVVLDTTPVLPIADAVIVARAVSKALFVVAADHTSRRAASDSIEKLRQVGVHVLGVVLNKVALQRHPYYYSRYYRRDYERYYHGRSPAAGDPSSRAGGSAEPAVTKPARSGTADTRPSPHVDPPSRVVDDGRDSDAADTRPSPHVEPPSQVVDDGRDSGAVDTRPSPHVEPPSQVVDDGRDSDAADTRPSPRVEPPSQAVDDGRDGGAVDTRPSPHVEPPPPAVDERRLSRLMQVLRR